MEKWQTFAKRMHGGISYLKAGIVFRTTSQLSKKGHTILAFCGRMHRQQQKYGWYGSHSVSNRQKGQRESDFLIK